MPKVVVAGGAGGGPGGPGAKGTKGSKAAGKKGKKGKAKKKQKKECKKKVSKKQKQKLRDSTPSTKVTNQVNSDDAGKDAQGRLRCPTCGQRSPPGFESSSTNRIYPKLSADHIVPVASIMKRKGFACLSEKNQKKVLNNPKNFTGICPPCNFARQTTKWNEWNGPPPGFGWGSKKFVKGIAERVPGISKSLGAQISRLWR